MSTRRESLNKSQYVTDLLSALADECSVDVLRPDDITVARVAALAKPPCHDGVARRKIMRWVEAGELVRVTCYDPETSRRTIAYRRPEKAK